MQAVRTRKRSSEVVYFIEGIESGLIKIGITYSPLRRLQQLQTGATEPLRLLGVVRYDPPEELERDLHDRFDYLRVMGEWFKPATSLLRCIADIAVDLEQDAREVREDIAQRMAADRSSGSLPGRTMKDRLRAYKDARGLA